MQPDYKTFAGSSSYNQTTAARESDVTAQVNAQDKLTMELTEYAGRLEEGLTRVLRSMQVEAEKLGTPSETLVPLANQLREHNQRLSNVVAKLNGILQRLEL